MKSKKNEVDKYWENEEGETVEFGSNFMRCYDKAGKLQFGIKYYDPKTGEKKYLVKFVVDRKELVESNEGLPYLKETLEEWKEWGEASND